MFPMGQTLEQYGILEGVWEHGLFFISIDTRVVKKRPSSRAEKVV